MSSKIDIHKRTSWNTFKGKLWYPTWMSPFTSGPNCAGLISTWHHYSKAISAVACGPKVSSTALLMSCAIVIIHITKTPSLPGVENSLLLFLTASVHPIDVKREQQWWKNLYQMSFILSYLKYKLLIKWKVKNNFMIIYIYRGTLIAIAQFENSKNLLRNGRSKRQNNLGRLSVNLQLLAGSCIAKGHFSWNPLADSRIYL